jgi:hypothetical protein
VDDIELPQRLGQVACITLHTTMGNKAVGEGGIQIRGWEGGEEDNEKRGERTGASHYGTEEPTAYTHVEAMYVRA